MPWSGIAWGYAVAITSLVVGACTFDPSVNFLGDSGTIPGQPDGSPSVFDDGGARAIDASPEIDAAPVDPAPAANSFSDGFDNSSIGSEWDVSQSGGCSIEETGSKIQYRMDGTGASRCTLTTVAEYDLVGSVIGIEVPSISNYHPPMSVFLQVENAQGDRIEFGFQNGLFYGLARVSSNDVFSSTSTYAPNPGYWRIREASGQIYLESSTNKTTWDIEMQFAVPFAVDHIHASFGVATSGPMPGSIGIQVPGFNTVL
jgi:hypothetical protein